LSNSATFLFSGSSLAERAVLYFGVPAIGTLTKLFRPHSIRFLEKTPKNSLRVPLLNRLFPDAYFIWNKREPVRNIDSLIAGWRATDSLGPFERERFATYDIADELNLRDYDGSAWKFALVPEWRSLRGGQISHVAAWQYLQCNRYAFNDLRNIEDERVFEVKHERFVRSPISTVNEILEWANLKKASSIEKFASALPLVNDTQNVEAKDESQLRYPKEVRGGISKYAELYNLVDVMGYDLPVVSQ